MDLKFYTGEKSWSMELSENNLLLVNIGASDGILE